MNIVLKFIIASIIGAFIGYVTNWVAIKMLFRPHNEKRFLGIKIPFTPGLIPKEKTRIAKSVGDAVGNHLLTKETIVEALCSDNMNKQLNNWVEGKIEDILNSDESLEDKLKELMGDKYKEFKDSMIKGLNNHITKEIQKEETVANITDIISKIIKEYLQKNPALLIENKTFESLNKNIISKIVEYKNSEELKSKIEEKISKLLNEFGKKQDTAEQVIPQEILGGVKVYIFNNRLKISKALSNLIEQPEVEVKIKGAITDMIGSNLSPMIAMFVNPEMIFGKIKGFATNYLESEENSEEVANAVNSIIDSMLKNRICDIYESISDTQKTSLVKLSVKLIDEKILEDKLFDDMVNGIQSKLKSYDSIHNMLLNLDNNYEKNLYNLLNTNINSIIKSKEIESSINNLLRSGVNHYLTISFKSLLKGNEEKLKVAAVNVFQLIFNRFVENKASDVVQLLDIKAIVEEKINSFDVAFAEEIILEIASKELRAITWLGALLGAIVGLLSPIIGSM